MIKQKTKDKRQKQRNKRKKKKKQIINDSKSYWGVKLTKGFAFGTIIPPLFPGVTLP